MAMSKEMSSKPAVFAKGGSTKMFGKQSAGVKAPAVTGKADKGNTGKFAAGGKQHMAGKGSASPAKAR
jgi:hypothetical protein